MSMISFQITPERSVKVILSDGPDTTEKELYEDRLLVVDGSDCYEVSIVSKRNSDNLPRINVRKLSRSGFASVVLYLEKREPISVCSIVKDGLELKEVGSGLLIFKDHVTNKNLIVGYDAKNVGGIPRDFPVLTLEQAIEVLHGSWNRTELIEKYAWEPSSGAPPDFLIKKFGDTVKVLRWVSFKEGYKPV